MSNEYVDFLRPRDFYRDTTLGYESGLASSPAGSLIGLPLPKSTLSPAPTAAKSQGYLAVAQIPASLTLSTGLTLSFLLADDGTDSIDLGKVVVLGVTVKRLADAETTDIDVAGGSEQTAALTLDATAGKVDVETLAIANANLDSAAVGDFLAIRVRRIGSSASDTCPGRAILLGVGIKNT